MNEHIVGASDADFSEIDHMTVEMGGLAEKLLADAFYALERRDPVLAEAAAKSDRAIDLFERKLQERSISMIGKRQPVLYELRHVVTTLKIAGDLERIGDLAKNIAKRAIAVAHESHPKPLMIGLRHMAELAQRQLNDVLDAFCARDGEKALAVWRADAGLDALYNSVFRQLLTVMMEDPRNIGLCTHLLFAAKNIERIGDHTTNIAENIDYLITGRVLKDERPKVDGSGLMPAGHYA